MAHVIGLLGQTRLMILVTLQFLPSFFFFLPIVSFFFSLFSPRPPLTCESRSMPTVLHICSVTLGIVVFHPSPSRYLYRHSNTHT
ncbi:hypothetical protein F5Y10DRAFT_77973 [Nemania abortiva]|nr:hypothetical protein F5Y10DRAFT_77973 [Nemania abortiva]